MQSNQNSKFQSTLAEAAGLKVVGNPALLTLKGMAALHFLQVFVDDMET